jgi:hypothetical protein
LLLQLAEQIKRGAVRQVEIEQLGVERLFPQPASGLVQAHGQGDPVVQILVPRPSFD